MTAAIIVHLEISDVFELPQIAEDVADALTGEGFAVISAAPWGRDAVPTSPSPTLSPQGGQAGLSSLF
jgi:hypothetical protein